MAQLLSDEEVFGADQAQDHLMSDDEVFGKPGFFQGTGAATKQAFGSLAGQVTRGIGMGISTMARSAEIESDIQENTENLRKGIDIGSGRHYADDTLSQAIIGTGEHLAKQTEQYWKATEGTRTGLGAELVAGAATAGGGIFTAPMSMANRAAAILEAGGTVEDAVKAGATQETIEMALQLVSPAIGARLATRMGGGEVASAAAGIATGGTLGAAQAELEPLAVRAAAPGAPEQALPGEPTGTEVAQSTLLMGALGAHGAGQERAAEHERMAGRAEEARLKREGPEPSPVEELRAAAGETKPPEPETKGPDHETQARQAAAAAGVTAPIEPGEKPPPEPAKSERVQALERARDQAPAELQPHIDDQIQQALTEEEQQRTGRGLRAMAHQAGNEAARDDLLAKAEELYPLKEEARDLGLETKGRSTDDLQHDVWRLEDHRLAQEHGQTPENLLPALVARADPDAFERMAIQHEGNDEGFYNAVQEYANANPDRIRTAIAGGGAEPRPGGQAPEPEVRGEHPAAAPVRVEAHAVRGEPGAGEPGSGERPEGGPAVQHGRPERGGAPTAEAGKPVTASTSPLLRGIHDELGGLHTSEVADTGLEPGKEKRQLISSAGKPYWKTILKPVMLAGKGPSGRGRGPLVSGKGATMDHVVEWMQGHGYLTDAQVEHADNNLPGGSHEIARELIRREIEKPGSVKPVRDEQAAIEQGWRDLQAKHRELELEHTTPEGDRAKAVAAERAAAEKARVENAPPPEGFRLTGSKRQVDVAEAAGQKPLFREGWERAEPGAEQARLTAAEAQPRMDAAVKEVKDWLDRKGLSWAHENTRYNLDETLQHGGRARLGPDGKYEISLSPETLAAHPNWAVKVLLHEHAHVVDWSGNLYSRHPDLAVEGGKPTGRAAEELYELHRTNPLMSEFLEYPIGKEGMNDHTLQAELFAQAVVARHVQGLREVMEREAPTATRLIDEALAHAQREGKLPEGETYESEVGRIRSQFAASGRAGPGGLPEHGQPASRLSEPLFSGGRPPGQPPARGEGTEEERNRGPILRRIAAAPLLEKAKAAAEPLIRDFQNKVMPMTTGSERAQVMAKAFANSMREAESNYQRFAEILTRRFTPEQNARMWQAGDEENEIRGGTMKAAPDKGLTSLPKEQRDVMEFMTAHGEKLLQRAREVGMFQGEGVPYWVPRIAQMIGEDGEVGAIARGKSGLQTKAPAAMQRAHFTTEESEAALKAKLGEGAEYIRDIRTMPVAMARLERAIAGRELVNQIHELSIDLAMDPANFTTFDHPALKSFRFNEQTGKLDTVNRLIPKEFEGPLKAVLTEPPGAIYKALLGMKNAATSAIMWSPAIHLGVELGRAAPVMRGKMATVSFWKDGLTMMRDPDTMRRFLQAGYVPQGRRNLRTEDIGQTVREPEVEPGRGLLSKAAGAVTGAVAGRGAGQAVSRGIDRFGDFTHGTLLWDRVAQLQGGIALSIERQMIKEGHDPVAATWVASHIANRYAGALPAESMSNIGRKLANLLMFSRSFTLGNLGAMKDVVTGLPRDVQASLRSLVGDEATVRATSFARRKALGGAAADIALLYGLNALVQTGWAAVRKSRDEDTDFATAIGEEGSKMIDRVSRAASRVVDHPVLSTLSPFQTIESFLPQGANEPDKTDRIMVGHQADGTAIYMRLPFGKVGEEFKNWLTKPGTMLYNKMSTLAKPLAAAAIGDPREGYSPNDSTADRAGKLALNFMKAQVPADTIAAAYRTLTGQGQELDADKMFGPLIGVTYSHGYPGGEAAGIVAAEQKEHSAAFTQAAPEIRKALKEGDYERADQLMEENRFTRQERRSLLRSAGRTGPAHAAMRRFRETASPEEAQRLEEVQQ